MGSEVAVSLSAVSISSVVWLALGIAGVASLAVAIVNERRMQRHRQPGVSYADVTWRRDGGWRRADLFTNDGLRYQRRASKWGVIGIGCIVLALAAWMATRALTTP